MQPSTADSRPAHVHTKNLQSSVNEPTFKLIIDTNMYAGNFEREMTAFCTGIVGECQVGVDHAELFDKFGAEKWGPEYNDDENHLHNWIDLRTSPNDNSPCYRPCTIYPSRDGQEHNSVCIYFRQKPTQEILDVIIARAHLFCTDPEARQTGMQKHMKNQLEILGFRWIETTEMVSEYLLS